MTSSPAIPVFILGGFLGSGKTSTLNHILRNSNGSKLGVIVNDFGDTPIDSYLIDADSSNQVQFNDGCICCEIKDGEAVDALRRYAAREDRLDAIFIEASGVADPRSIANMVRYSGIKNIIYGGIIYTVDTLNFKDTIANHPELKEHLKAADVILLNKVDLATEAQFNEVKSTIAKLQSKTMIIPTRHGAIDPGLLFDLKSNQESPQLSLLENLAEDPSSHTHHAFSKYTFRSEKPLNPRLFTHAMHDKLANVYRIKGIVYFGMKGLEQKYTFQSVRGDFDMTVEEWGENEEPRTEIVAIGIEIDTDYIEHILSETIDVDPSDTTPGEMVDIRRLLERSEASPPANRPTSLN